jgi:hypothetical protein
MASTPTAYVPANPGDLITAEGWNMMQSRVQQDIAAQVAAAVAGVKSVDHAKDADTLDTKNLDDLMAYVLAQVFAQLPKRTGYMQYFVNLHLNEDKIITHGLKAFPLTDVYQLEYFPVICAKDDSPADARAEWVLFYLYHSDERRLRLPSGGGAVDIETQPVYRILWKTLIEQFVANKQMPYTDEMTLDDLEVEFWKAMFAEPNGRFDADATCHSPWFEKCCGEKRTVAQLTTHGDFDDIYLKMVPSKTINSVPPAVLGVPPEVAPLEPHPEYVRVAHLDQDRVVLKLLYKVNDTKPAPATLPHDMLPLPSDSQEYMPVMLLLKA